MQMLRQLETQRNIVHVKCKIANKIIRSLPQLNGQSRLINHVGISRRTIGRTIKKYIGLNQESPWVYV